MLCVKGKIFLSSLDSKTCGMLFFLSAYRCLLLKSCLWSAFFPFIKADVSNFLGYLKEKWFNDIWLVYKCNMIEIENFGVVVVRKK